MNNIQCEFIDSVDVLIGYSRLRTHLRECFGVEVPIYHHPATATATARDGNDGESRPPGPWDKEDGVITGYARISHQVYNTVDDYHKFRDAIYKLLQEGNVCKMLLSLTQ